jgi:hypothetical protein
MLFIAAIAAITLYVESKVKYFKKIGPSHIPPPEKVEKVGSE